MEELFPYQKIGAPWLASKRLALLADECGLGKTAQAITACDLIQAKRILVLVPAVVRINWARQFEKFSTQPWRFDIVDSSKTILNPANSIISSYSLATKLADSWRGQFDVLILDEFHALTNIEAKRTSSVLGANGLVHRVKRVWALSGTPAPNHAGELWPLLYVFGVTKLSHDAFINRYCHSYRFNHIRRQVTGTKREMIPELHSLLKPIMLRRLKKDVMTELPPILFEDIVVEPGPVDFSMDGQNSLFQYIFPTDMRDQFYEKIRQEEALIKNVTGMLNTTRDGIKALEALAKSVSTLRMWAGIQKIQPIADMVKEELNLKLYKKIVIFAIHRDVIEGLRRRLEEFSPVTLYGGTDPETKQRNIDKFQQYGKFKVFIGNIEAAGVGIDLHAAHHIIMAEQAWSPGKNNQAIMRVHRLGQKEPVNARFIGLAGSIDERVAQILRRKTKDLHDIFDADVKDIAKALLPKPQTTHSDEDDELKKLL